MKSLTGIGCFLFLISSCGLGGGDPAESGIATSEQALLTFSVGATPGFADGPVSSTGAGRIYARDPANNRLFHLEGSTFLDAPFITDTFVGRPAAAWQGINTCSTVFVRKNDGSIGFSPEAFGGSDFGCQCTAPFSSIPSLTTAGGLAATAWSLNGVFRYDVFTTVSVKPGHVRLRWIVGTGTNPTNPSWGSVTLDSSIDIRQGTSPAAVSVAPGQIDLVACDSNGNVQWKEYLAGAWSAWQIIGSGCASSLSIAGVAGSKYGPFLHVVALDSTSNVVDWTRSLGNWFGPTLLGGPFVSPPSVRQQGSGYRVWTTNASGQGMFADY